MQIALLRIGGVGDTLILTALAVAVKRKFPESHITAFVRGSTELITDHPDVDRVIQIGNGRWEVVLDKILEKPFDMVFDNRYVTKVYCQTEEAKAFQPEFDKAFIDFQKVYDGWIESCNILPEYKMSSYDIMFKSCGLPGDIDEDLFIKLDWRDFDKTKLLDGEKYVTIHNGADVARQTKCWLTEYWNAVVSVLNERKYKVIQLGQIHEPKVDGVLDMRGRTTLKEASALITKAQFHIGNEGGLIHLAKAVKTRSIVMFGPTPRITFEYAENISIETPKKCKGCWWRTQDWWRACPERFALPVPCMKEITPQMVIDAVYEIEKLPQLEKTHTSDVDLSDENEQFAVELALTEEHYRGEPHQWDRIYAMMSLCKGKKVLEVGAGDGYCVQVLRNQGFDVSAVDVSKIRLARMKDKGINALYGDVNDLPFEDGEFDTVICGEVLEHIESIGNGFKELERVCHKNGRIVISLPVAPVYKEIEMHKWGIDLNVINKDDRPEFAVLTFERLKRDK